MDIPGSLIDMLLVIFNPAQNLRVAFIKIINSSNIIFLNSERIYMRIPYSLNRLYYKVLFEIYVIIIMG